MKTLELYIPGCPIAKPRVRATKFGSRIKMYAPTSRKTKDGQVSNGVAEFKALVRRVAADSYTDAPLGKANEPRVDCCFVFPRTKAQMWKKKPMVRIPKTTKPDRDNLDKMVLDSLTGVVLEDDNCVWGGTIEKWHAAGDEQPHTLVTIYYAETPDAEAEVLEALTDEEKT